MSEQYPDKVFKCGCGNEFVHGSFVHAQEVLRCPSCIKGMK